MDFLLAILPIGFLIYVMTKKKSWPSHISLPFAAILVYLLVLVHARLDPNLVNATVVNGILSALTPVSINIVAVTSIMGLNNKDGFVLKRTVISPQTMFAPDCSMNNSVSWRPASRWCGVFHRMNCSSTPDHSNLPVFSLGEYSLFPD